MKKNISDYLVSLAVIACSVVLLAALTIALTGYRLKKPQRTLAIDYVDVTGIKLHSEVRYAGAPAGRVIEMRHLTEQERADADAEHKRDAVRITVEINESVPALPSDVVAGIASDTLLSEKFVALSAGTPGGAKLAKDAVLQGQSSTSLDTLMSSLGPIFNKADATLADLHTQLDAVLPKVGTLLDNTQVLATNARTLLARADKLIADNETSLHSSLEKLPAVVSDLREVEHEANDMLGKVDGFIGDTDHQLAGRMRELSVVLQNLKVVTTQAKAVTQTLGEKPSRLIWGFGPPKKLTPEAEILKSAEPLPAAR